MAAQNRMQALLATEMTRRQFIIAFTGLVVTMTGFAGIAGLFAKNTPAPKSANPGYGRQGYGP